MRFALLLFALLAARADDELPVLMAAGNAAYLRGDYAAARESFLQAWGRAQQMAPAAPERYDVLKRLASVRAAEGEFAEADDYLQMAINWRENTSGLNDPKVADDLLQSVTYCRGMKNYDRADLILNRVMGIHRSNSGAPSVPLADDFSRRAQIAADRKMLAAAIADYRAAIAMRTEIKGPLDVSLVPDLDRLGTAQIAHRAYDDAEQTYRRSLIIREGLLGREDPDLIASIDGLAYSIFGQKKYEEAEPIYQRLIALWEKSVGADHPMVAMTLDKVAVFYAEQKKYDEAREASARASAIRAHFLAFGLSGAAAQELVEGHGDEALALYRRAIAVLDPPSPIYDDLRTADEQVVKALTEPAKPASKAPPRKKP
jgi:tetratricopeptide (TPR) repeat protein